MIYLRLFAAFMKIGFTSFGGMSMIPVIMQEMKVNQWMTAEDLTNLIAIAEMTPGPLGINCATFAGMQTAGVLGGIAAVMGVLMPAYTLTLGVAVCFAKFRGNDIMSCMLDVIKPICIAMILAVILNLMQDLQEEYNLTYMFITHDLSVVKYISDRVGVMYLGNMVELAEADEIFHHPIHPYTEALLNAIPTTDTVGAKELSILEGDIPSPVNPPKGCKFHTRCKYCTEICTQVVPAWEEVRPNHFVACHHKLEVKE